LRQAILDANGNPGYDTIDFQVGSGVAVIWLSDPAAARCTTHRRSPVKAMSLAYDGGGDPELFFIGLDDQVYGQAFDGHGDSATTYFLTQPGRVKSLGADP
jgi:hypothetical protein